MQILSDTHLPPPLSLRPSTLSPAPSPTPSPPRPNPHPIPQVKILGGGGGGGENLFSSLSLSLSLSFTLYFSNMCVCMLSSFVIISANSFFFFFFLSFFPPELIQHVLSFICTPYLTNGQINRTEGAIHVSDFGAIHTQTHIVNAVPLCRRQDGRLGGGGGGGI